MRVATIAAGAATVLVLSGIGAFVIDRVRSPAEETASDGALGDPGTSSTSLAITPGVSTTLPSTTAIPAVAQRPPVVTFDAANGQATVSGAVPTDEVYQRIAGSMVSFYGEQNVVLSSVIVDPATSSAQWMDSADQLVTSLHPFDDYRVRFDGETLTGMFGGGAHFDSGSAALPEGYEPILQFIYDVMAQDGTLNLEIQGHTDSDGAEDSNLVLSQGRADAVRDYLVGLGLGADRLTAEGKGELNPATPNDTPEGRARNRRVVLILTAGQAG
jgi:outer membrane protein OmpA-like peptidoglycan-associated protein